MKDKGLWEEFSMLNYMRLNSGVLKGKIDEEIKRMVDVVQDYRLNLSKRKDLEKE